MSKVVINNEITRTVQIAGATGATGATGPTGPTGAAGADGADGEGVPVGGTTDQVLAKASATDFDTAWVDQSTLTDLEAVAGGAGFTNVSGAVTLDLSAGRSFHHIATANITGPTFTNVPDADAFAASWTWVLSIDVTGGYTLTSTPTVTFVDGSSFADADLSANAVNIFTFWRIGTITYAALVTNGSLALDPYTMTFQEDGSILIAVSRAETIDLGNVTNLEADGTAGTGTLSYEKNGVAASGSTSFAADDVLTVTLASSTTATAVSIPRYAA